MEDIVRRGEIACNKQFLFFSQCFLPYMAFIFHFKCTLKCRLQMLSSWTSLKLCRRVMGQKLPEILCILSIFLYRNGTSMISLIIPPKDQISRVSKMLADEFGTASNIKSRVNRLSVLGAITSVQQRLKLYNKGQFFRYFFFFYSLGKG